MWGRTCRLLSDFSLSVRLSLKVRLAVGSGCNKKQKLKLVCSWTLAKIWTILYNHLHISNAMCTYVWFKYGTNRKTFRNLMFHYLFNFINFLWCVVLLFKFCFHWLGRHHILRVLVCMYVCIHQFWWASYVYLIVLACV